MLKAALLLVFLGGAHEASAQVQGMTWSIDQPCGRAIVVGASVMGVRPKSEHATCAPHLECPRAPRLTATKNQAGTDNHGRRDGDHRHRRPLGAAGLADERALGCSRAGERPDHVRGDGGRALHTCCPRPPVPGTVLTDRVWFQSFVPAAGQLRGGVACGPLGASRRWARLGDSVSFTPPADGIYTLRAIYMVGETSTDIYAVELSVGGTAAAVSCPKISTAPATSTSTTCSPCSPRSAPPQVHNQASPQLDFQGHF